MSVSLNPGQPFFDPRYLEIADHVVNFEGTYETYLAARFPDWIRGHSPNKFWHLIYEVPDVAAMRKTIELVGRNHAGLLYVTDAGGPNPWNRLPSYWEGLVRSTVKRP